MTALPASTLAPTRTKLLPVIEIFGPTIQGEGAEAGIATHFLRVGGCDYRCAWCDTMYAVDPKIVRATAERLSSETIVARVAALPRGPEWVTISGGNPALHELGEVVAGLRDLGFRVSVETQGSRWASWLGEVDRLTVSPKPPSSGMETQRHAEQFDAFMTMACAARRAELALKIVIFDEEDLAWGRRVAAQWSDLPLYLSAGTPMPAGAGVRDAVGERYAWLCEVVALEPSFARARVLPQLHVIAWKGAVGV